MLEVDKVGCSICTRLSSNVVMFHSIVSSEASLSISGLLTVEVNLTAESSAGMAVEQVSN